MKWGMFVSVFLVSLTTVLHAQTAPQVFVAPVIDGDVSSKNLSNAWMKNSETPQCGGVYKKLLPNESEYTCIKTCGDRTFYWIVKKSKDRRFGNAVSVENKTSLNTVAELELEPMSALSVTYNESAFGWFDKTVLKFLKEALKCDSSLSRTREPDFLTEAEPDFSRTCPGTDPLRTSTSRLQPAGKADKKAISKPYVRVQFSDSRGHEIEAWSTNKMNVPRLANDLAVHRLSRCPL